MLTFTSYPICEEICTQYGISVNGKKAEAVNVRVSAMPFNRLWPGSQRPADQTETAAYISLATDEDELSFCITAQKSFGQAVVRPLYANIIPKVEGNTVSFSAKAPGFYTLELDGKHNALHIFIDPIRNYQSPEEGVTLISFPAGVHEIGHFELQSNTAVYIHRDAVVYGSFFAADAKNIRIFGEGVLDGSKYERTTKNFLLAYDYSRAPENSWERKQMKSIADNRDSCFTDVNTYKNGSGTFIYRNREQFTRLLEITDPVQTGLSFYASENITVEGLIFRNCAGLSITQAGCKNVHFNGIKVIGMWRYNSDGIDFYNCADCSVKNSFLRTFDDTICVKGQIGWDTRNSENILFEKCVLWNDWGHTMDIGIDTVAPEICNITFRDCDCIHTTTTVIDVGNADRAFIHDVVFENIRVEYSRCNLRPTLQNSDDEVYTPEKFTPILIDLFLTCGDWSTDRIYGKIANVVFKDIAILSEEEISPEIRLMGHSGENNIEGVVFENVSINGKALKTPAELNISSNEFAEYSIL